MSPDLQKAAQHLSQAITFKTISYSKQSNIEYEEFKNFLNFLQATYPHIHKKCEFLYINKYSPVFIWHSPSPVDKPLLLLGHYDVVPVEKESEKNWLFPPFSGALEQGYIWGRGALDNKNQVIAIMEAVDFLIKNNYQPKRDIYIAFGFDEEIGGYNGAQKIAEFFEQNQLSFDFIIDEGGCITRGVFNNIPYPVALVGIGEKSVCNLKITTTDTGGHSSMPSYPSAIGKLAKIVQKLENKPMPLRITWPVAEMLKQLGNHDRGLKKFILKNINIFFPIFKNKLAKDSMLNAMLRTTFAFTMCKGSDAPNVIPQEASAVVNVRILPGDTIEEVIEHIKKVNTGIDFSMEKLMGENPAPLSSCKSQAFEALKKTILKTFPSALIMPYLMVGATDARHYRTLSSNIYRFSAMLLAKDEIDTIHAANEKISLTNLQKLMDFYINLIEIL